MTEEPLEFQPVPPQRPNDWSTIYGPTRRPVGGGALGTICLVFLGILIPPLGLFLIIYFAVKAARGGT